MKDKVVFLDRDGTINVDYGYVYQIEKLEFKDGVIDGLKKLQALGYKLVIITNQSGIARGYYTKDDFEIFMTEMKARLQNHGVTIDGVYYCPHNDEDKCDCRKPKTGLYRQAMHDFDVDWSNSFVIGDNERDLSICKEKPITGILISEKPLTSCLNFDNFMKAAVYIEANGV